MLGGFRTLSKDSLVVYSITAYIEHLRTSECCLTAPIRNRNIPISVSKTFSALPKHNRLRVVATYHFIDRWEGQVRCHMLRHDCTTPQLHNPRFYDRQMGFMKIGKSAQDSHYVWTERYGSNASAL